MKKYLGNRQNLEPLGVLVYPQVQFDLARTSPHCQDTLYGTTGDPGEK